MEILIYGFGAIIKLLVFLAILSAPCIGLYFLGKKLLNPVLGLLLPVGLVLGLSGWLFNSYSSFKETCQTVEGTKYYTHPKSKPDGIVYQTTRTWSSHGDINLLELLDQEYFKYVDYFTPDGKYVMRSYPHKHNEERLSKDNNASRYVVISLPLEAIDKWALPYLYIQKIKIVDDQAGKVIAELSDMVFGGGLLGILMRLKGGDQDYDHLSCGYVSKTIGAWRPTLTSSQRFEDYLSADRNFISVALTPDNNESSGIENSKNDKLTNIIKDDEEVTQLRRRLAENIAFIKEWRWDESTTELKNSVTGIPQLIERDAAVSLRMAKIKCGRKLGFDESDASAKSSALLSNCINESKYAAEKSTYETLVKETEVSKPSFDCFASTLKSEMEICRSQNLSSLESNIHRKYEEKISNSLIEGVERIKGEQKKWTDTRRTNCETAIDLNACLNKLLNDRLNMINR